MPFDPEPFIRSIQGLLQYTERTYGTFRDSSIGLVEMTKKLNTMVDMDMQKGKSREEALAASLTYVTGQPGTGSKPEYRSTVGERIEMCKPDGPHEVFLGNMCITSIYSYWESVSRPGIATALKIELNDVQSPLFSDLRKMRHCILHADGKADKRVESAEVLSWFKANEQIVIGREKLKEVVMHVRAFPKGLRTVGFDPFA